MIVFGLSERHERLPVVAVGLSDIHKSSLFGLSQDTLWALLINIDKPLLELQQEMVA
jgi:hypothetical protein